MDLTADNLDIHGLWIGDELSRMEILTIKSFINNGHRFHLWVYKSLKIKIADEFRICQELY